MGSTWEFEDVVRKYAVLRQHCEKLGRPYESVLRTFYPNLLLAETEPEVQAKVEARAARWVERPRLPGMPREFRPTYVLSTPKVSVGVFVPHVRAWTLAAIGHHRLSASDGIRRHLSVSRSN
jgi:hypothetical protein